MNVVDLQSNIDPRFYRLAEAQGRLAFADSFSARRPSVEERLAAGKALRQAVPRLSHANYASGADRPNPLEILEKQTRVQKLVPTRYGRMLASLFAFLRGSAAIMAADLSNSPVSGLRVAACGDMHVKNLASTPQPSAT